MKRILITILFIVMLSSLSSAWFWQGSEELYNQGIKQFEKKHYKNALVNFQSASQKNSKSTKTYLMVGCTYSELNKVNNAKEWYSKAYGSIDFNKNQNDSDYLELNSLLYKYNHIDELYKLNIDLLSLYPNNSTIKKELEPILIKKIETINKTSGNDDANVLIKQLIGLYDNTKINDAAISQLKEILNAYPENEDLIIYIADCYLKLDNKQIAVEYLGNISKGSKLYKQAHNKVITLNNEIENDERKEQREEKRNAAKYAKLNVGSEKNKLNVGSEKNDRQSHCEMMNVTSSNYGASVLFTVDGDDFKTETISTYEYVFQRSAFQQLIRNEIQDWSKLKGNKIVVYAASGLNMYAKKLAEYNVR